MNCNYLTLSFSKIANTKIGQYNPSDLWIIYHGKFDRFYEFKDQHISLCLIPKVASTSQTELMRTLAKSELGTTENWKVERYIHQNITEDSLSQDYRIMIVRHPFERLLSAYLWFLGNSFTFDSIESMEMATFLDLAN